VLSERSLQAYHTYCLIDSLNPRFPKSARFINEDFWHEGVMVMIVVLGLLPNLSVHELHDDFTLPALEITVDLAFYKIVLLVKTLGPQRIVWCMERYNGIRIAFSSVHRILVGQGVRRFPTRVGCRVLHTCAIRRRSRATMFRWTLRFSP